jgi:hypothetical protein
VKLQDADVAPIGGLTGLRALELRVNRDVTDEALLGLSTLTQLEWLGVEETAVSGTRPGILAPFPNLCFFDGYNSQCGDGILRELGTLTDLEWIGLEKTNITVEGLAELDGLPNLRGLNIENMGLSGQALVNLGTLPNLCYLALEKNQIDDDSLRSLRNFPALQRLDLDYTPVTDRGIAHLSQNTRLEQVFLSHTKVTPACFDYLLALPVLHFARLDFSQVPEADAARIGALLAERVLADAPRQASSNPDAPKVGLVMSYFTAAGPHALANPYGYAHQSSAEAAKMLDEANFDVYAVVEPGTQYVGELPAILLEAGLAQKVVDGTDVDALRQLDVIMSIAWANGMDAMLEAFDRAVSQGVGLVGTGSMASLTPGSAHPTVARITGIEEGTYLWMGAGSAPWCPVVAQHPILGTLVEPGQRLPMTQIHGGTYSESGIIHDGEVLLGAPPGYPEAFPVMYVRNHGQGRVVRAQWHKLIQPGLPFSGYTFYIRALNWAAQRDVDAVW